MTTKSEEHIKIKKFIEGKTIKDVDVDLLPACMSVLFTDGSTLEIETYDSYGLALLDFTIKPTPNGKGL